MRGAPRLLPAAAGRLCTWGALDKAGSKSCVSQNLCRLLTPLCRSGSLAFVQSSQAWVPAHLQHLHSKPVLLPLFSSVQFTSVAQSCLTLCDPMYLPIIPSPAGKPEATELI